MDRVAKNVYWLQESPYGDIEMTINLSKPEKSPKEIAMARLLRLRSIRSASSAVRMLAMPAGSITRRVRTCV